MNAIELACSTTPIASATSESSAIKRTKNILQHLNSAPKQSEAEVKSAAPTVDKTRAELEKAWKQANPASYSPRHHQQPSSDERAKRAIEFNGQIAQQTTRFATHKG